VATKRRTIESLVLILVARTGQNDKEHFDADITMHPHAYKLEFGDDKTMTLGGPVLYERLGLFPMHPGSVAPRNDMGVMSD
jgi:hypothetical protein